MIDFKRFLCSKVERSIKNLYLQFLYMVEDLRDNGQVSEDEFTRLRKRILDYGNASSRDIVAQIEEFEIKLGKTKE